MNMSWIDWSVVFCSFAFFVFVAFRTQKYTKSTADFLAANRSAGRYLLTLARGIASLGAISIIATFQQAYKVGYAAGWWGNIGTPVMLLMMLSGWVIYRFRETRALTLGQYLEMRYSRRFRVFAATICWTSGIVNFGIFPSVGANFFINYCGLPASFSIPGFLGGIQLSTYHCLMFFLIAVAVYFTISGGQVVVLVIDFLQSFFCNIVFLSILVVLLIKFPLTEIFDGLLIAEPGKSMVNPFDASQAEGGFNPGFFIIGIIAVAYGRLAWQGTQAYNSSAKSPHEAKMAGVVAAFRSTGFLLSLSIIPLVAYMIMHHPDYTAQAQQVTQKLSLIANEELRDQMLVPVTMTLYLPVGMMGAFAAVMFVAFISTNDTYLHSWASIFVQDIVSPLLKKPLKPKQRMLMLRLSVLFVALFIFTFSCFFRQTQNLLMFFAITGAVWAGAGAVIIGGLYTRWGNTAGAYAALIAGASVAVTGLILEQLWMSWYGTNFILTGQEILFITIVTSASSYVVFSLFFRRRKFNLDKLLHRGKYAIQSDHTATEAAALVGRWNWRRFVGITEDFTPFDKFIYGWITFQAALGMVLFVGMTTFALIVDLSDVGWSRYHRYMMYYGLSLACIYATYLSIAGIRDLIAYYKDLKTTARDLSDDGRVIDHDYAQPSETGPLGDD